MPGTILLDDAQQFYTDRLKQHAQNALQAVQTAAAPITQAVTSAPQELATAVSSAAPQIDPNQIIQNLQQHAQDAWANVQPPPQPVQPALDPNEITQRLQQHADAVFQAVDQSAQQIGQGLQQAVQPAQQAVQQIGAGVQQTVDQGAPQATPSTAAPPDRSMPLQDYARAAAQRAGIDPDIFVTQIQQESGFTPTAKSPAGALGIAQFMPATAAGMGVDPTDPYASLDAAARLDAQNLKKYGGDYAKTLAAYNAGPGAVDQYGGVPPYKETQNYVQSILGKAQSAVQGAASAVGGAAQAVGTVASNVLPTLSQFGDKQLTAAEAYSACGPAAAVRFAQMYGRNPTLREATDLARGVGWTQDSGMAGLQSESKLFDQMNIPHRVVGADWQALQREAQSGNPVTISTPGHYFTADSYDPQSGAFHVGSSGTDLKGGSEWMTPAQMEARMGPLQGGLAADNPGVPAPSPISARQTGAPSGPIDQASQFVQQGGQAIQSGLQQVDSAVQGAVQAGQQAVQGAAQALDQNVVQPARQAVQNAAQNPAQTAQDLLNQAPLPWGVGKVGDVTGAVQDIASKIQTPDESNPLPARVAGTGLSALGTVAREAADAVDRINIGSTATRELTGGDVYGQKYAAAGGPELEDEYRKLLNQRLAGDDSVTPRMTDIVNQLQSINDTIRDGKPLTEVNQALSAQNPLTPLVVGAVNLGAAALAAPLAAGDAPLAARALAEVLQPGTNPLEIVHALTMVNDARGAVPEVARAVDEAWQRFGGRIADTAAQRAQQIARMDDSGRNQLVRAITNAIPGAKQAVGQFAREELGAAGLPADVDAARAEQAGTAFTAPETVATPSTRMYHGTGSDFARVDPTKVAGEDNLFGPGYYLTSDPRVAGGVVASGGEQVGPSWLRSAVKREPGSVISRGYAQETAQPPDSLNILSDQVDGIRQALQNPDLSASGRTALEDLLTKAQTEIQQFAGPNVRSVDVPQDLNLFDMERPVPVDQAETIAKRLWGPDALKDPETASEVASWSTPDADGAGVYELIRGEGDGTKTAANRVLADAGFDGIEHSGGKRIPMADANGQNIEHNVNVIFPDSLEKVRNALSGRAGGAASPRFATTLGGAAAGGAAGNASTPDDALTVPTPLGDIPLERGVRTATGALLGAGAGSVLGFRGPLEQQVLEQLRQGGLVGGGLAQTSFVPPAQAARGAIARGVDFTKQSILTNPATHIANIIGNTIELARQPVALAMGGRGDDALAGLVSAGRGIPEAAQNAWSAIRGNQLATLSTGASAIGAPTVRGGIGTSVFRALSASDAFTRTLAEYQGMASEANRLLREAGMTPSDPGAASYLASHAADLAREGARAGAQSVFGRVASASQGTGVLDNMFKRYANIKEGLLASPDLKQQAMGALMDFAIPFSGVPVQMLQIGMNRLPVAAQASGAVRAARALKAGDVGGASRAVGEMGLESAIQLMIAKGVAGGNITGPDDPDHPNSIRVNGQWMSMNDWGAYALPMQIMASFADGFDKGGQDVPDGSSVGEYYGPRFQAAFNASLKPFKQGIPGENIIRLLARVGEPGGATGAALGTAQDAIGRIANPGALRFVENLTDPVARDVDRKGVASLWEPAQANIPGLANLLPGKIDPTTGEVLQKVKSGPGTLIGAQREDVESPLSVEANRLNKAGFKDVIAPRTYPQDVTIGGSKVSLSPDEQREVTQITGSRLDQLASRLNSSEYQNAPDERKALMVKAMITAADAARVAAVTKVLGSAELRSRVAGNRQVAGRLVDQAEAPTFSFDPLSGLTVHDQRALATAGSR